MAWSLEASWKLPHLAASGFVLLGLAALAVRLCSRPAERIRIIEWTFCGCLMLPVLQCLELLPMFRLGLLPALSAETAVSPTELPEQVVVSETSSLTAEHEIPQAAFTEPASEARPVAPPPQPSNSVAPATALTHEPSAVNETAEPQASSSAPSGPAWIIALYALGVLMLALRLGWGFLLRARLWRSSKPAPWPVVNVFQSLAQAHRGKLPARVRLAVSPRINSPVTWGLFRPVIVVPESWLTESAAQLRCGLAHEWSHIERRDIRAAYLGALVELVFFYQPLYWWLKRTLALSQDQLADSLAQSEFESAADYAQLLVNLARREKLAAVPGAMGILSHPSRLFWRIRMLLNSPEPLERRCRRPFSFLVIGCAMLLTLGLSAVNLASAPAEENTPPADNQPAEKPQAPESEAKADLEPYTYKGQVVDRITQKPIEGVEVIVKLSLTRDPKTGQGGKTKLRTITAKTNANGDYEFTLTGEEHAASSLYIVVDARHPNYASKGESGYAHGMIQKNLRLGDPPFFAKIQLWPGESIEGTVTDPAGKPLAGVEILTYAAADQSKKFPRGSFGKTKTDNAGRFRIVVPTPGDGVLWLTPKDYSPQAHRLKDKRGDWGQFTMTQGTTVTGKVLDARGKPVPHVHLDVRRRGDGEEVDEFLGQNAVANHIGRNAAADGEGEFQLASLPPGDYGVRVRTVDPDSRQPIPDAPVFVEKSFTIPEDQQTMTIEVQAVPHVLVQGKMLDGQGQPTSGHEFHVFGRINGSFFFGQSNAPGKDGRLEARLPHGLENVQINLMTNEHGVLRWRLSPEEPLKNGRRITLDRLEEDLTTLEVVRYVAPILMVKAVDEQGEVIADSKPKLVYENDSPKDPNSRFISGVNGDVNFDKQPDGRWRSNQLLPDQKFTLTVEKDGWGTTTQTLSLEEKTEKEVVFVLKKKAD